MHSPLRHLRALVSKERPIHLTYFATRRCNARCPFCFYERARDARDAEPELSAAEVRQLARSLGDLLWVLFSGGEVFLRDDLADLSRAFHDANRPAFLTYPTNGLLPEVIAEQTEEIVRRCPDSVVVVKLSLDGIGDRHDSLRRTPGGFAKAMRTCEALSSLSRRFPRLELGINTLFCARNQDHMDEIIGFVRELDGVRSHTLTMVRGALSDPTYKDIDLGAYDRASRRLAECWRTRGTRFHRFAGGRLKAAQDRVQRRLISRTLRHGRRLVPCYAGRLNLVLSESGELSACEERRDESFGNVRKAGYDVTRLLQTDRAAHLRAGIARGGCYCSHECNFLTNILFNPGLHPSLIREYARLGA